MLFIQLYGKKTSGYSFVKKHITDFLDFNDLHYEMEEINSVNEFINDQINSIPCVIINRKHSIEISKYEHIKKAILIVYRIIIDDIGLHQIKKIIIPFDYSKSSYHAFLQSKQFITHDKYVIQLAYADNLIEKNFQQEQQESLLNKMTEKLEDDYVGDIAHITPIYHKAVSQDQWPSFLLQLEEKQSSLVLYNYDSNMIPFSESIILSFIHSPCNLCLIYDTTYLKKVKDLIKLAKEKKNPQLTSTAVPAFEQFHWHHSLVDFIENGQDFNVFSKSSSHDPSVMVEDIQYCIHHKIPFLII